MLPPGARWDAPENAGFADEYDGYLRQVAARIRAGQSDEAVAALLIRAEEIDAVRAFLA